MGFAKIPGNSNARVTLDQRSFQCFLHLPLPHHDPSYSGIENYCRRPTTHEKKPFFPSATGFGAGGKGPLGGEGKEDRRPLDSHPKTAMCLGLEPQQPFMYVGRDTAPEAEGKNPRRP